MESFIGFICMFGGTYAPFGWLFCNGQLLPIQQYSAVFSLLGIQYGGNGTTHFALPDLRGKTPIGMEQLTGGSLYAIGESSGESAHTLTINEMPSHTFNATTATATVASPANAMFAASPKIGSGVNASVLNTYAPSGTTPAGSTNVLSGGAGQVSLMQPYLAMNYCINLQGTFPARN